VLLITGAAAPIQAWYGWKRTEAALRHGTPLPAAPLTVVITIVVTAVGTLVLVGVLLR